MRLRRRTADLRCREAVALVTDYLDGALPAPQRRRLERHLAHCPHCAVYLAQIQAMVDASRLVDETRLSPHARETLLEMYRQAQAQ